MPEVHETKEAPRSATPEFGFVVGIFFTVVCYVVGFSVLAAWQREPPESDPGTIDGRLKLLADNGSYMKVELAYRNGSVSDSRVYFDIDGKTIVTDRDKGLNELLAEPVRVLLLSNGVRAEQTELDSSANSLLPPERE